MRFPVAHKKDSEGWPICPYENLCQACQDYRAHHRVKTEEPPGESVISLTVIKDDGYYRFCTIHSQGDKIVKVDASEPEPKAIALEKLRKAVVERFVW